MSNPSRPLLSAEPERVCAGDVFFVAALKETESLVLDGERDPA